MFLQFFAFAAIMKYLIYIFYMHIKQLNLIVMRVAILQ